MIYKKDGETLDHVADNRLISANSVPYTSDTIPTLVSGRRDNLLAVKDYTSYSIIHKTFTVIECYNGEGMVYRFTYTPFATDYYYPASLNSAATFITAPEAFVIPQEAINVEITDKGTNEFECSYLYIGQINVDGIPITRGVGTTAPYGSLQSVPQIFVMTPYNKVFCTKAVYEPQGGPGSWRGRNCDFINRTAIYRGDITKIMTRQVDYDIFTNEENS